MSMPLSASAVPAPRASRPLPAPEPAILTREALAFVKSLTPQQIDGTEDKEIAWTAGSRQMSFKGQAYLQWFALPNFYFFVTTTYNILRHRGVEIGKRDFLGAPP